MDSIIVPEFANLAGISRQRAWFVCRRGYWNGRRLDVQEIEGQGGKSGTSYLVKVSSLPQHLQDRLKALQAPVEGRPAFASGSAAARERTWWLHVLGPVLEHPKGSPERKAAYAAIAAAPQLDWHGRRIRLSVRTLQRRVERMEGAGSMAALAHRSRADKGERRVHISRAWDAAVPFDEATRVKIAGDLRDEIRSLVKSGATWSQSLFLARRYLVKATSAFGFRPADPAELERICAVPKRLVSAEMQYRKVHRHKKDRKASEDDRPRVRRSIAGLRPMEMVVMDVHPIDVLIRRPDGSTATPRLLGFMDIATQRVWCELVFLHGRGGVRNVDLIEAFAALSVHPAFGLPEIVYCDNGKEYMFADFLDDAMQLVVPSVSSASGERSSRIIRALPYNAPAKPIEQWFGRFEQQYLTHLPGWVGGDRMNMKQEAVGRTVAPFEGGFDAFRKLFFSMLRTYENFPQPHGQLGGKSPAQAFAAHVAGGWSATVMDPENLLSVFTRPHKRAVRQHTVSVDGRTWTCPELDAFFGDVVIAHVPVYHGFNELLLAEPGGRRIGIARPEQAFSYHDPRGAERSAARTKARNAALRQLDRSVPDISIADRLIELGQSSPDVVPNAAAGTVTVSRPQPAGFIVPEAGARPSRRSQIEEQLEVDAVRARIDDNLTKRRAS